MGKLLDLLKEKRHCNLCSLREECSQVVMPQLPKIIETGSILWLGRNPGETEDAEGAPFVGKAGKELDKWFEHLGWQRKDCIIENAVACYTQGNRQPTIHEINACSFWLKQELEIIKPKLIIALGKDAALAIGAEGKHGEVHKTAYGVSYLLWHPSFILRKPSIKKNLLVDLDRLKKVLKNQEKIAELRREFDAMR